MGRARGQSWSCWPAKLGGNLNTSLEYVLVALAKVRAAGDYLRNKYDTTLVNPSRTVVCVRRGTWSFRYVVVFPERLKLDPL